VTRHILAGDVGGTHVRLALVAADGDACRVVARARSLVRDCPGLADPVARFLAAQPARPDAACLGVAGTVEPGGRRAQGVNLPWALDAAELEQRCGLAEVRLISDFEAVAWGVGAASPEALLPLGGGEPRPGGPIAVLGAGTGLGQALRVGAPPQVVASEGGHRGFAPANALQDRLLAWLRAAHGRVSTERVLSGPGLAAIYRFLVEAEGAPAAGAVEAAPPEGAPAAVTAAALVEGDPTAAAAVDLFVDVYGAEAGDLALTALATGGVYVAGGIAPRLFAAERLRRRFRAAFEAKGRLAEFVRRVPVWVVTDPDVALLGAALAAGETHSRRRGETHP